MAKVTPTALPLVHRRQMRTRKLFSLGLLCTTAACSSARSDERGVDAGVVQTKLALLSQEGAPVACNRARERTFLR